MILMVLRWDSASTSGLPTTNPVIYYQHRVLRPVPTVGAELTYNSAAQWACLHQHHHGHVRSVLCYNLTMATAWLGDRHFQLHYNLQYNWPTITHNACHWPKHCFLAHDCTKSQEMAPARVIPTSGQRLKDRVGRGGFRELIRSQPADTYLLWLHAGLTSVNRTVSGAKNTTQFSQHVKCVTEHDLVVIRCDLNGGSLLSTGSFSFFFPESYCHGLCFGVKDICWLG